jgi:hypothetical protein
VERCRDKRKGKRKRKRGRKGKGKGKGVNQISKIQNHFHVSGSKTEQFPSSSMGVKNINSLENQKKESESIPEQKQRNNIFHSYTRNQNPKVVNMSSFEESKYSNEWTQKTLTTSYRIEDHIRRLSKKEILANYQTKLQYCVNSLNLKCDPTFKFDKIMVNLGKRKFIVKNYQIKDGRPNTTLRELRLDLMKDISSMFQIDQGRIQGTRFRGLNEHTYLKQMKNIIMYIEESMGKGQDSVILRIINVDGKFKNFLPFDSKYIEVSKHGNLRDVLTTLENVLNVSMVYFQLAEYFPFEVEEDKLNQSSFCSISNKYLSIPNSSINNTSMTIPSTFVDGTKEDPIVDNQELGLTSDITFKEVLTSNKTLHTKDTAKQGKVGGIL